MIPIDYGSSIRSEHMGITAIRNAAHLTLHKLFQFNPTTLNMSVTFVISLHGHKLNAHIYDWTNQKCVLLSPSLYSKILLKNIYHFRKKDRKN